MFVSMKILFAMKRFLRVEGSNSSDCCFFDFNYFLELGRFLGILATGDGYISPFSWGPCQNCRLFGSKQ